MREFHEYKEDREETENREEMTEGRPCHRRGMHRRGMCGHRPHMRRERPNIGECDNLGILMMIGGHMIRHKAHRHFGLTQDRILRSLAANGEQNQKDLQEELRIRPGSVSEVLRKMEEKGLIERSRDEEDRRNARISLTEQGKAILAELPEEVQEPDYFACLNEEEKETLKGLLKKVLVSWEAERPKLPEEE